MCRVKFSDHLRTRFQSWECESISTVWSTSQGRPERQRQHRAQKPAVSREHGDDKSRLQGAGHRGPATGDSGEPAL